MRSVKFAHMYAPTQKGRGFIRLVPTVVEWNQDQPWVGGVASCWLDSPLIDWRGKRARETLRLDCRWAVRRASSCPLPLARIHPFKSGFCSSRLVAGKGQLILVLSVCMQRE